MEKDIRCPLEYGLSVFGGKWKSRIICVLNEKGTLRYSALRGEMLNITDAVLAAALKELIADELVERHSYKTVVPILQSICRWSGAYTKDDQAGLLRQCQKCDFLKN